MPLGKREKEKKENYLFVMLLIRGILSFSPEPQMKTLPDFRTLKWQMRKWQTLHNLGLWNSFANLFPASCLSPEHVTLPAAQIDAKLSAITVCLTCNLLTPPSFVEGNFQV